MQVLTLVQPALAAGVAALVLAPAVSQGVPTPGWTLPLSQRYVRLFDHFQDPNGMHAVFCP